MLSGRALNVTVLSLALAVPSAFAQAQEQGASGVRLGEPVVVEVLDEGAAAPQNTQPQLTLPDTSGPDGPFKVEGIGERTPEPSPVRTNEPERTVPAANVSEAAPQSAPATQTQRRAPTAAASQRPIPREQVVAAPAVEPVAESDASAADVSAPAALPPVASSEPVEPVEAEPSAASTWSAIAIVASALLLLLFAGVAFAVWRMIRNGQVLPSASTHRSHDPEDLPALLRPLRMQPSPPAALPPLGARGPEPEKPAPRPEPPKAAPAAPQIQTASAKPMFNYSLTAPRVVDPRKVEKA